MDWIANTIDGRSLALLGAAFAYFLPATASGVGGRMVAEAANGVLAEDPKKFVRCLILQAITATQGIYGLITAFLILNAIGFLPGATPAEISTTTGLYFLIASLPVGVSAFTTGISQGRAACAGVSLIAKRPEQMFKAITHAVMIETFQIFGLVVSILILFSIQV